MCHQTFQKNDQSVIQICLCMIGCFPRMIEKNLRVLLLHFPDHRVVEKVKRIEFDAGTDCVELVLEDSISQRCPDHSKAEGIDGSVGEDGVVEIGEDISM